MSSRAWADAHVTNAIVDIHADDPEFGYRFIADELDRAGRPMNETAGMAAVSPTAGLVDHDQEGRKRLGKTPGPAVHDDLVEHVFGADRVDEVWLTDITEHPTLEGKVYVCAIKDVCSNRIVGYAIDERMTAQLAVHALRSAIARRRPNGTVVVQSDRRIRTRLRQRGGTGSMISHNHRQPNPRQTRGF